MNPAREKPAFVDQGLSLLVTGARGQLDRDLVAAAARAGITRVHAQGSAELDVTDPAAVFDAVSAAVPSSGADRVRSWTPPGGLPELRHWTPRATGGRRCGRARRLRDLGGDPG